MTGYECKQAMRRLETEVRKQRDLKTAAQASGSNKLVRKCNEKIRLYTDKYNQIADASGITPQPGRMGVVKIGSVDNLSRSGIIKENYLDGSIFNDSEYNPEDIKRAITQKGTNFVTHNVESDEYDYGVAIESVKPIEGIYDIKAHGDYDGVKIFDTAVDAQELARIIALREDYSGEPIRLLSCNTGKEVDGICVAKELSRLLGVEVYAPNDVLITDGKGWIHVGKDRFSNEKDFVVFTPKEIQEDILTTFFK